MAKSDDEKTADKKEDAKGSGGIKEFLPLILALTIMPVVAFAMTQFVLIPQLQAKLGTGDTHAADGAHDDGHGSAATPAHGSAKKSSHGGGEAGGEGGSNMATLKKLLVNVKGTAATRYLISSFALTGSGGNISTLVEEHDPQLRDIAMGILMNLSIDDLGQAEIKNRVKVMLVSAFNDALGGDYIENIFFTEFAVQ